MCFCPTSHFLGCSSTPDPTNEGCFACRVPFSFSLSHFLLLKLKALASPASYNSLPLLQIVNVAISLAKVADIDQNLGNEDAAVEGFQEGIKLLQSLKLKPEEVKLEQRRLLVLEFLNS